MRGNDSIHARWGFVGILGIVIGVVLLYAPALRVGFLTDDYILLADIQDRGILSASGWLENAGYFRPLVSISLAADMALFGTDPLGYHATNLILHVATVLLVYLTLASIVRQQPEVSNRAFSVAIPLAGVAFFAFHPAHSTDIVWISARSDLLAGMFLFGAFALHVHRNVPPSPLKNGGIFALMCCALCSKEIAVFAPIAVAGHLFLSKRKEGLNVPGAVRESLSQTRFFWIASFLYLVLRLFFMVRRPVSLNLSDGVIYDVPVLFGKTIFVLLSPLDPLTALEMFMTSPWSITIVVAMALVTALVALIRRFRLGGWRSLEEWLLPVLVVFVIASPLLISGIVIQRLMYVPMGGFLIVLMPVISRNMASLRTIVTKVGSIAAVICILALFTGLSLRNVHTCINVAALEVRALAQLTSQLSDPNRPIVIVSYPHRVLQSTVLWTFEYALHFATTGRFGMAKNVRTGFGIIGSDADAIGHSVTVSPSNLDSLNFTIAAAGDDEYLMLDQSQLPPASIDVVNKPGMISENLLVKATVENVNRATRPVEYRAIVKDTSAWRNGYVFVWNHGQFDRIR